VSGSVISLVQISAGNYERFQRLVHWRVTGERNPLKLPAPTSDELAFADRDGFWVFAAEIEGELVGWISLVLMPKPDKRVGLIYVDELWTAPELRRQGVAESLLEVAIAKARELRLWKVRLYVGKHNPAARALYRKMGFLEDAEEAVFCQREP